MQLAEIWRQILTSAFQCHSGSTYGVDLKSLEFRGGNEVAGVSKRGAAYEASMTIAMASPIEKHDSGFPVVRSKFPVAVK